MSNPDETPLPVSATVLVVHDGRHPFSVLVMVATVFASVVGLIAGPSQASALDHFIGEPWRTVYYLVLLFGSLVVSVSVWLPDIRDRLIGERVGMLFWAGALTVYPIALYAIAGLAAGLGGIITSIFGIAGIWRIIEITLDLHKWRATIERVEATK
jgi:hypothetical protein